MSTFMSPCETYVKSFFQWKKTTATGDEEVSMSEDNLVIVLHKPTAGVHSYRDTYTVQDRLLNHSHVRHK